MRAANRRDNGVCFWGCSRYPACRGSRPMASLGEQVHDARQSLGTFIRALGRLLGR
jgi:ssDNA-binding Zn-finger/Zn-ribbon topoisomerase 1